jgi:hypothetical protein
MMFIVLADLISGRGKFVFPSKIVGVKLGALAQAVDHLPSKPRPLVQNSSTAKKKKTIIIIRC